MDWLIALLIVIVIFALPVALIVTIIYWYNTWSWGGQYISFSKFLQYYNTNPNKWELEAKKVFLKSEKRYAGDITCRFGPIGYYRYLFWHHNLENQKLAAMFEDKENKNETSI